MLGEPSLTFWADLPGSPWLTGISVRASYPFFLLVQLSFSLTRLWARLGQEHEYFVFVSPALARAGAQFAFVEWMRYSWANMQGQLGVVVVDFGDARKSDVKKIYLSHPHNNAELCHLDSHIPSFGLLTMLFSGGGESERWSGRAREHQLGSQTWLLITALHWPAEYTWAKALPLGVQFLQLWRRQQNISLNVLGELNKCYSSSEAFVEILVLLIISLKVLPDPAFSLCIPDWMVIKSGVLNHTVWVTCHL